MGKNKKICRWEREKDEEEKEREKEKEKRVFAYFGGIKERLRCRSSKKEVRRAIARSTANRRSGRKKKCRKSFFLQHPLKIKKYKKLVKLKNKDVFIWFFNAPK